MQIPQNQPGQRHSDAGNRHGKMGSHHSDSTGLTLVTTAQTGGGRFHFHDDDERTLCGRPITDDSISHSGDWVERLAARGTSTAICAKCRRKRRTVMNPEVE